MENNILDKIIEEFKNILEEKKEPINFYELFEEACKNLKIDEKNVDLMSDVYYKVMILKDFLLVGKNEWALRKFYKYQTIKKFNDETMKIEKDSELNESESAKVDETLEKNPEKEDKIDEDLPIGIDDDEEEDS
ncbi:DNA-directed RNA polymerase subunit delta [symbiont of Argiope bruennichi]|uniref:DNA-directed RNA polymerase subunit delta n=1 Tax=symbiont of Argiope bruennichi TaxID=2810479 RepID=UPI003DA550AB